MSWGDDWHDSTSTSRVWLLPPALAVACLASAASWLVIASDKPWTAWPAAVVVVLAVSAFRQSRVRAIPAPLPRESVQRQIYVHREGSATRIPGVVWLEVVESEQRGLVRLTFDDELVIVDTDLPCCPPRREVSIHDQVGVAMTRLRMLFLSGVPARRTAHTLGQEVLDHLLAGPAYT